MGITAGTWPLRWAVIIADLEPTRGHEQGGTRRALVVSYEPFHRAAALTVCPITAARSMVRYPNSEGDQTKAEVILCHQGRTISLLRATGAVAPIGYLTNPRLREQVRAALARHLGLDIPAASGAVAGGRAYSSVERGASKQSPS